MISAKLTKINKIEKGFTLIELLIVIGILAVLMGIVLVAINPAKQFKQANDTKRRSDVNAILNAVDQYAADNKGAVPANITTTAETIGNGSGQADICSDLVTTYIAQLPADPLLAAIPNCTGSYNTGYTIVKSATDNRVTVSATSEVDPLTPITVTR